MLPFRCIYILRLLYSKLKKNTWRDKRNCRSRPKDGYSAPKHHLMRINLVDKLFVAAYHGSNADNCRRTYNKAYVFHSLSTREIHFHQAMHRGKTQYIIPKNRKNVSECPARWYMLRGVSTLIENIRLFLAFLGNPLYVAASVSGPCDSFECRRHFHGIHLPTIAAFKIILHFLRTFIYTQNIRMMFQMPILF